MPQQAQEFDISKIWSFVLRRWPWFAVPFVIGLIATVLITLFLAPYRYVAYCNIFIGASIEQKEIDREANRLVYSRESIAKDRFESLRTEMRDDRNIHDLIVGSPASGPISGLADDIDTTNPIAVEKLIKKIRDKDVKFQQVGNEWISVTYTGKSPEIARAVLTALFGKFKEQWLSESKAGYLATSGTRNKRLKDLKEQIEAAEKNLTELREKSPGKLLMTEADYRFKELDAAKARLNEIDGELTANKKKLEFFTERLLVVPENKVIEKFKKPKSVRRTQFEGAISQLEINQLMLKDQYTDDHPTMKKLQEQINKLKAEMEKEPEEQVEPETQPNEAYWKYSDLKNDVEFEIKQLEGERIAKTTRRSELEADLSTIPELKKEEDRRISELGRLRVLREEAEKDKVEADKRYVLAYADKIDAYQLRGGVQVFIQPDPKAIWLWAAVCLAVTMILSLVSVALREVTDQSLKTVDEARDFLALPSLGIVPVIVTPRDSRRRRIVRIIIALAAVVLIGIAVWLILPHFEKIWSWAADKWDQLPLFD